MKATSEDQFHTVQTRRRSPAVIMLFAAAVLAAGVFFLLRNTDDAGDTAVEDYVATTPLAATQVTAPQPAPDIPRKTPPKPTPTLAPAEQIPAAQPEPQLPTPEEADALLMQTLEGASVGTQLRELLNVKHPLDVSVAMVDGLSQGAVPRKLLSLPAPGKFSVAEVDGQLLMGDAAYARYDRLVEAVAAVDTAALAAAFHRLRPLMERAYSQLGMDEDKFDNAVIRALDRVLATPEIEEPIALVRKSVMHTYADPTLENRVDLQKQLLRMGPDNLRIIKQQARALRQQLLAE